MGAARRDLEGRKLNEGFGLPAAKSRKGWERFCLGLAAKGCEGGLLIFGCQMGWERNG
jgi:hypothetical protein